MYADFADNKGPILYLVFALLSILFDKHLIPALVIGSTVIDTIALFVIIKVIERDWDFKWNKRKFINYFLVIFSLFLYKSFTIGTSQGGLYSENVGLLFLALSTWFLKKDLVISGILFSFSYLSRITYIAFLPFFIFEIVIRKKPFRPALKFVSGQIISVLLLTAYLFMQNDLSFFIYNIFELNINYAQNTRDTHFLSILIVFLTHPVIFLALLFTTLTLIFKLILKQVSKLTLRYLLLIMFSSLATFAGGTFYFHHFIQFSIPVILSIFFITQKDMLISKAAFIPLIALIGILLYFNYFSYVENSKYFIGKAINEHKEIKTLSAKENIVVVPYYIIYYFVLDRKAPDKYFQSFFLMSNFNPNNKLDIEKHKSLDKEKIKNTTFLFIHRNKYDKSVVEEYKRNFKDHFSLKKVNEYKDLDATIEIYESSGK